MSTGKERTIVELSKDEEAGHYVTRLGGGFFYWCPDYFAIEVEYYAPKLEYYDGRILAFDYNGNLSLNKKIE